VKVACFLTAPD